MSKSYYIRRVNPATGNTEFSRGGTSTTWGKNRKVWGGIGPFKNHIALFYPFAYTHRVEQNIQLVNSGKTFPSTLIPFASWWPFDEHCVIVELDEDDGIKEYPANEWIWANSIHPRLMADESAKKKLDPLISFAVESVRPLRQIQPSKSTAVRISDEEIQDLIAQHTDLPELVRAAEELTLNKMQMLKK